MKLKNIIATLALVASVGHPNAQNSGFYFAQCSSQQSSISDLFEEGGGGEM